MSPTSETVPSVFLDVRTEPISPMDVACAQATFNEVALYDAIEQYAREWFSGAGRPARILDMCASSGLCAMRVSQAIEVERLDLIDVDPEPLALARQRLRSPQVRTIVADAVCYNSDCAFDLILMNSAYHHIVGRKKLRFLLNAARHLAPGGRIIVGDHFLPAYKRRAEFRRAVVAFYGELLEELEARSVQPLAVEVIRQAAYQCWCGVVEFKVSWPVFQRHFEKSGLRLACHQVVWRPKATVSYGFPVGSAVAVLECP